MFAIKIMNDIDVLPPTLPQESHFKCQVTKLVPTHPIYLYEKTQKFPYRLILYGEIVIAIRNNSYVNTVFSLIQIPHKLVNARIGAPMRIESTNHAYEHDTTNAARRLINVISTQKYSVAFCFLLFQRHA